jgi:hypothetical protein
MKLVFSKWKKNVYCQRVFFSFLNTINKSSIGSFYTKIYKPNEVLHFILQF